MSFAEFLKKLLQQFDTLPERLGGHIELSLAALGVGILISVPLGIWVAQRPRLESIVMTIASVIQTIPSLALLALMVFAFGTIGWKPAWIALILYSILPMLRNTVTGIQGIDPAYMEAAAGIGMNAQQTLLSVQLPLALPSIIAGIRTASVWVVGAATLAQPVGAVSLGNYIFVGLQTLNFAAILFGCVFSALLALAFDGLLRGMEIAARDRSLLRALVIGSLIAALACFPVLLRAFKSSPVGAIGSAGVNTIAGQELDSPLVIASKTFAESYILMEVIKQRLEKQGLPVETKGGMGSAFVFEALVNGEVDCYVDYTGTLWTNQMKQTAVTSPVEILVDVATFLKAHNIVSLGSMGFSNDYVFMMRQADAERLEIVDLADLARHAGELKLGYDIEFFDRPEWPAVRDAYGLNFQETRSMSSTLMYGALDNQQVDVIVAFRTDGRTLNLAVIDDPKSVLPPYDGVLIVSNRMARNAAAMKALRPLVQSISSTTMSRANAIVDVEGKSVSEAADWLSDQIEPGRN